MHGREDHETGPSVEELLESIIASAWELDAQLLKENHRESTDDESIVAEVGNDEYGNPVKDSGVDIYTRPWLSPWAA